MATLALVNDLVSSLTPAAVLKAQELPPVSRELRIMAKREVCRLWADIDASRPCPAASYTIVNSDGSTLPFKVWAETVLGIRDAGKAHAVSVR
jgi:hypothetical protein